MPLFKYFVLYKMPSYIKRRITKKKILSMRGRYPVHLFLSPCLHDKYMELSLSGSSFL